VPAPGTPPPAPAANHPSTFPEHFRTTRQEIIEKVTEIFNRPTIALSPRSAGAILETHAGTEVEHRVNETVARGLVATLIKRETEWKAFEADLRQDHRTVEMRLERYEKPGAIPVGFERNHRDHPSLLIPYAEGLLRPAYWIKQLDNGKVAMLDKDGDHSHPYITDIYAAAKYDTNHPFVPMPLWFRHLLTGPAPLFDQLRDSAADLDDWGVLADVLRFREYDDDVARTQARIEQYQAEYDGLKLSRSLVQSQLEAAQAHTQMGHLEALHSGHPRARPHGAWRKRATPDTNFERGLST